MHVRTDHQIVGFGADRMILFDNDNPAVVLVEAVRDGGSWTVTCEGHTATVDPDGPNFGGLNGAPTSRRAVISTMIDQALAVCPGDGYSTLVPHGLLETP